MYHQSDGVRNMYFMIIASLLLANNKKLLSNKLFSGNTLIATLKKQLLEKLLNKCITYNFTLKYEMCIE